MMRRLVERAEEAVATRQRAVVERIGAAMATLGRVEVERDSVRLIGRGLARRWLQDSQLRFVAEVVK